MCCWTGRIRWNVRKYINTAKKPPYSDPFLKFLSRRRYAVHVLRQLQQVADTTSLHFKAVRSGQRAFFSLEKDIVIAYRFLPQGLFTVMENTVYMFSFKSIYMKKVHRNYIRRQMRSYKLPSASIPPPWKSSMQLLKEKFSTMCWSSIVMTPYFLPHGLRHKL